ncbi:MAG: hypothetical protein QOF66_6085 [Mycobacterium sp.]|jgi:hypothetical protein|nr:hypothetical protein [Mycobacterium sp.]
MSGYLRRKTIDGSLNNLINIALSALSATGTPSSSTYLRGDGSWSTPPGIVRSVTTVTSTVTASAAVATDYVILIGASGVVTLPTAVGNTNLYMLKNIDTTNKTVATTSSQTIDGATTFTLSPTGAINLVSDGSNWRIF